MSARGGASAPVPVRVYRPVGALVVACIGSASLVAMTAVIAFALPARARGAFTVAQDVTLALIMGVALVALYGIGRTRVRTDATGVMVVNGYRRHDVSWPEAVTVALGRGAPWAVLDTSAGRTVQLMGIQRADGERAFRAVRDLRSAIAAYGGPADGVDGEVS